MKNASNLERIPEVDALGLVEEDFELWVSKGENSLGKESIFKCEATTANELLGYELASMLKIPVPLFKGVWVEDGFLHPDGIHRPSNSVGLFVEKIVPFEEIYLLGVAQIDKRIAAQHLLLRLFLDGGEYSQMCASGDNVFHFDLEFIGPEMSVDKHQGVLERDAQVYVEESGRKWEVVLGLIQEYNVLNEFCCIFNAAANIMEASRFTQFSVTGHPRIQDMSRIFADAVVGRYSECTKYME